MRVRRKRRLPGTRQTCQEQWRPWNFPHPWAQNHCLLHKRLERSRWMMEWLVVWEVCASMCDVWAGERTCL